MAQKRIFQETEFLNLGELLQLVGSSSATGTLRIFNDCKSEPGVIVIDKAT
jgi:hypothetical protein